MTEPEIYPVPSSDFCKRLYEYDQNLQLNWDPAHRVWSIWFRDPYTAQVSHVMNVIEHDGGYRPLDERVFHTLKANRYFSENPEELAKKLIDPIIEDRERQQKFVHEELGHLAKDRTLNKKFDEVVDKARSVSWKEWLKPIHMRDENGMILFNYKGEPIIYNPHRTLVESPKKPTNPEDA